MGYGKRVRNKYGGLMSEDSPKPSLKKGDHVIITDTSIGVIVGMDQMKDGHFRVHVFETQEVHSLHYSLLKFTNQKQMPLKFDNLENKKKL